MENEIVFVTHNNGFPRAFVNFSLDTIGLLILLD